MEKTRGCTTLPKGRSSVIWRHTDCSAELTWTSRTHILICMGTPSSHTASCSSHIDNLEMVSRLSPVSSLVPEALISVYYQFYQQCNNFHTVSLYCYNYIKDIILQNVQDWTNLTLFLHICLQAHSLEHPSLILRQSHLSLFAHAFFAGFAGSTSQEHLQIAWFRQSPRYLRFTY